MAETVEQSYNQQTSYNAVAGMASALQIRLDTSKLLEDIEMYLKASQIIVKKDEVSGKIFTAQVLLGTPKANAAGIQSILNCVSTVINPQVVQGNFPSEAKGVCNMFDNYIEELNINIASNLVSNSYEYGMKESDVEEVCDFIMMLCIPFMTRLIDNKERDSYAATIKTNESNVVKNQDTGGFRLFGSSSP